MFPALKAQRSLRSSRAPSRRPLNDSQRLRTWDSTLCTCRPSTPSAGVNRKARTTPSNQAPQIRDHRGQSGPRMAATSMCIPTSAHSTTSTTSSRARQGARPPSSHLTWHSRSRRITHGRPRASHGSSFDADGTIAYTETHRRSTRTSIPSGSTTATPWGLIDEVVRIIRFWADRGVRIFRVDNPHTKPVRFWDEVLGQIHDTDPDILFPAEAFTRRQ